jgi:hypothetical protein
MRTSYLAVGFSFLAAVLAGCVSVVDVRPFTGTEKGVRYRLPETFLLVTPQADGTATYEWQYPALGPEYAVATSSLMSKYTLDLKFKDQLLEEVTAKPDTSTVAAKLATTAGDVISARKDAANAAAKTAADKEATAATDAATKRATADAAVATAQLAVDQAKAVIAVYNDPANAKIITPEMKLQAELALKKAEVELAAANAQRAALAASGAFDRGRSQTKAAVQAWGPVLFRVVMTKDGVELRSVEMQTVSNRAAPQSGPPKFQREFDAAPATTAAATTTKPDTAGKITLKADAINTNRTVLPITATDTVKPAPGKDPELNKDNLPVTKVKVQIQQGSDDKTLIATFSPALAPGKYTMDVPFIPASGIQGSDKITFDVK